MTDFTEFEALDYHDFARTFLCEDAGPGVQGKLSKRASEINRENTEDANRWASEIFNDIRRGLQDIAKRMAQKGIPVERLEDHNSKSSEHKVFGLNRSTVELKIYRIGSWANEEVPSIDIRLSARRWIEVNVYDDESIMVKLSPVLVRSTGLPAVQVVKKVDKVGPYINGIVEKQVWR